jgi:hypothetical protein
MMFTTTIRVSSIYITSRVVIVPMQQKILEEL